MSANYLKAHGRALQQGPYDELVFELKCWRERRGSDYRLYASGRAKNGRHAHDYINDYLATARRKGVTGGQLRRAVAAAGIILPDGVVSLGRLMATDLANVKDSWLRYWCNIVPRVLVAGACGELDGAELAGRVYSDKEINAVMHLCVTAQAEDLQLWSRLAAWACEELYPEYKRRTGKEHKCQQRAVCCTYLYPSDW